MTVSRGRLTRLLVASALLAVAQPRAQTPAAGAATDRGSIERLGPALESYVAAGRLPGAVTLVSHRGRIVHSGAVGYRDREAKSPMRPDTIFRIASQSKALVSVGIMQLQEEGALLISDPVGRYIPEFTRTTVAVRNGDDSYDVVPARRQITIRDLLTHTAGLGYGSGIAEDRWRAAGIQGWYFADRGEPVAAIVARMAALPFDAHPGERWVYGYATDVLGVVIEKVAGKTLDEFIRHRITAPLGMRDTHFYLPPPKADRLAAVYSRTPSGLARAPDPGGMVGQGAYVNGPRTAFSGGAGLLSTAPDYMRFLQALLNRGTLDGVRILSRKSVELMTVDHLESIPYRPGEGFGLGFSLLKDLGARGTLGSPGEFGWGGAYHSTYWVDPAEELIVVHLTQVIPASGLDDYGTVRAIVYASLPDRTPDISRR